MTLGQTLRRRIAATGPIPFEEFMAACLYDPDHGFFASGPLRSTKAGDFLTSPEVSHAFGATLAAFVDAEASAVTGDFVLVDVGAGSGSLLDALLATIANRPTAVYAVELSPAARRSLAARLPGVTLADTDSVLPERFDGVVVANELLDNLPVRIAVRSDGGWEERYVGVRHDRLTLVPQQARPETVAWADAYGGTIPEGGLIEVQLAAGAFVRSMLQRLGTGSLVVIDYGGTAEELEPRRTRGTLRTYRAHHLGPDPLLEPGATDITVDVNFTAMVAAAEEAGARVDLQRQDDFLASLGLRDHVAALRTAELEAARDPAAAMERLRLRSQRTDAETLLHPRGLGDFRVMIARKEDRAP